MALLCVDSNQHFQHPQFCYHIFHNQSCLQKQKDALFWEMHFYRSCSLCFTERKCHMHIAHTRLNSNEIEGESKPFASPISSCNMLYRREGWLIRHIVQCHQASEEASTPPPTTTTPTTKNKTRIPTITPEFKCPLCSKILPTKKRNDPPLLFKAPIFHAQGHVSERNHCWDDHRVVGI